MRGRALVRNRGFVVLGVVMALTAVLLLVVLNAGASPPAPFSASSCTSSGSPCVLTAGGAGMTVTFTNTGGKSTTALGANLVKSPTNAGFAITSDLCSGTALGPNKTCRVTVAYTGAAPTTSQTATLTVATKKAPVQSASAYFTVTQANHTPVATNDSYDATLGDLVQVSAPGVLANDTDADSDSLTATLVSGTATLNSNGSFSYQADTPGTNTFTYEATDIHGAHSNIATVTINVSPPATATPPPGTTPTETN